MQKIHILHSPLYSANDAALVFPLAYHRTRLLRDYSLRVNFFSSITPMLFDCNILCLSSRFFTVWWKEDQGEKVISLLADMKRKGIRIIWFDIGDSSGTTQFRVLPYVDRYCKSQALKNRALYQKRFYGFRIYTDFYHREFQVNDADQAPDSHLHTIPDTAQLPKIIVGWNSGLAHYGYWGMYLSKIWHRFDWIPRWYPSHWNAPSPHRPLRLSCRIGASYSRETVAFSRKKIKELLGGMVATSKIGRFRYFNELQNSITTMSPFGLGEITLRDFEAVFCGAAVIKQNMAHLETWPNLWEDESMYIPIAWDFSDFEKRVEDILRNPKGFTEVSCCAQQKYQHLLMTPEGHRAFFEHFVDIIR